MQHHPWYTPISRNDMLMPFMRWMRDYSAALLKADLVAGLVVAVVLIPQAMAYALLAGLPPVAGFYAALIGAVAAALWGSAGKLSTGPVAILSFLVFSSLAPLAEPGSAQYIALAAALAIISGFMLFALGMLRWGFIMRFIPHTVVTGFAAAAAIIIGITQLPALFGFAASREEFMLPSLVAIARHIADLHLPTLLVGVTSLALIWFLKRTRPRFPAALVVLVFTTAASYIFGFAEMGIALVGTIQATFPIPDFSVLTISTVLALLSKAVVVGIIGFVSTYAIASSFQSKERTAFDVDQELVGQGMANMLAGVFRGFPVCGSFSRTAINVEAGARTGMASIFAAGAILLALFFAAPALAFIPLSTLAAIIVVSILDLIDIKKIRAMYRLSRTDGIVAAITFGTALMLKPDDAVLIGVIFALALFMHRMVRVKVRILGIESTWNILQGVETGDSVQTFPDVLMVRAETSAFYGNIEIIIRKIDEFISRTETEGTSVKALVLDCSSITYMDLAGAELLHEYARTLKGENIGVYAIYMHRSVLGLLSRMDALDDITPVHNIAEMRQILDLQEPNTNSM